MLRVWSDSKKAGVLDRLGGRGSTFVYDVDASVDEAVSITMPVRRPSWDIPDAITPIFEMNMPEGVLRERLRKKFAKALGRFEEIDVLGIVGRSQIGRLRFSGMNESLDAQTPFQSVDEILKSRRGNGLYDHLIETFAEHSGISGIQPKIMIRDTAVGDGDAPEKRSSAFFGATHIVKFWSDEYPELAANEYFCLEVARRIGLHVPKAQFPEDGSAIVIDRFDLLSEGRYRGFEDLCVLNAHSSDLKYDGSYEKKVFKRLSEFISPACRQKDMERLFTLFVLNCAVRNGDAHLKNFGIVYDTPSSTVSLAPVYDVVTTAAYAPQEQMALTLNDTTDWPDAKSLIAVGRMRAGLGTPKISQIFENIADTMSDISVELKRYFDSTKHPDVGDRMIAAWQDGVAQSLGLSREPSVVVQTSVPRLRP